MLGLGCISVGTARAFLIVNDSPALTLTVEQKITDAKGKEHRRALEIPSNGLKIISETDENRAAAYTVRFKPGEIGSGSSSAGNERARSASK
jgi:hypothetical protein